MKKETIGILICTLLISVAVAPVINALDNEINEVNIIKEPAFSSPASQDDAWGGIINDIITRFEAAQTQESKIAILEEIPVIMDIHGLLPEDMTVEETQELIVSAHLETIASGGRQSDKQSKVAGDSPLAVSKSVVHSTLPQYQVSESNRIVNHNIKLLNPPQPAPFPPDDKTVWIGFGRISNLKREFNGDEYYWSFNCINVRCCICEDDDGWCYWYHFTDGEVRYLSSNLHGTGHFMFNLLNFYLVVG